MERPEEHRPVLVTAADEAGRLEAQRAEIEQTLGELVRDIREIQSRLRQGTFESRTETGKLLGDLRYWLRAARDTEAELEAIRRKQAGIGDGYGLDLDAAERAIGCRLHRIRTCCGAERVPE
ncbi:hypothetical protein [Pseudoponticoccus marisrubri]|nr:hypothetical protein [Pseudoponticoccus marisrubri]